MSTLRGAGLLGRRAVPHCFSTGAGAVAIVGTGAALAAGLAVHAAVIGPAATALASIDSPAVPHSPPGTAWWLDDGDLFGAAVAEPSTVSIGGINIFNPLGLTGIFNPIGDGGWLIGDGFDASAECTEAACNGGNAGLLWGSGGNGANGGNGGNAGFFGGNGGNGGTGLGAAYEGGVKTRFAGNGGNGGNGGLLWGDGGDGGKGGDDLNTLPAGPGADATAGHGGNGGNANGLFRSDGGDGGLGGLANSSGGNAVGGNGGDGGSAVSGDGGEGGRGGSASTWDVFVTTLGLDATGGSGGNGGSSRDGGLLTGGAGGAGGEGGGAFSETADALEIGRAHV